MKSAFVLALVGTAGAAWAQWQGQATRVVTDAKGTHLEVVRTGPSRGGAQGGTDSVLWTFNDPVAIAQSVALGSSTSSAWVGQWLNVERMQRFPLLGPAVATFESPGGSQSPSMVAASKSTDLAVYVDLPDAPTPGTYFQVRAYHATGGAPVWVRELPDTYTGTNYPNFKVSRDGSTVALALNAFNASSQPAGAAVYFLDGATGATRQTWFSETGGVGSVDLTDDGSKCVMAVTTTDTFVRLIDTSTATEIFSDLGSAGGAVYQISGDGNVMMVGGFSLYMYKKTGTTYTRTVLLTTSGWWYGWGSAVSRDGSTVADIAHQYTAGYLNTATRIWDVATGTLQGTYSTTGTGQYQDSIVGAVLSDNGSRLLTATWGTQNNDNPEIRVLDRGVHVTDNLDTPGSPFSIDLSGDGRYALIGTKSVHANVFGNGGNTYVLDLGGGSTCYANCDGSTSTPVLNVADFTCFLQRFAATDSYANCDGSTSTPVLNVADFTCFLQKFAAGCP